MPKERGANRGLRRSAHGLPPPPLLGSPLPTRLKAPFPHGDHSGATALLLPEAAHSEVGSLPGGEGRASGAGTESSPLNA